MVIYLASRFQLNPGNMKINYIRGRLPHIQTQPAPENMKASCFRSHITTSKAKFPTLYTSISYNFK